MNRTGSYRFLMFVAVFCASFLFGCSDSVAKIKSYNNSDIVKYIADPHVMQHEGVYYLYGTTQDRGKPAGEDGIKVYTSTDLVNWSDAVGADDGHALAAKNSWGNKMFWAPEVFWHDGRFYMFYTVEERLAVAMSDSPLGPFVQEEKMPLHLETPEIDPHVFFDDDGKVYLFFVRFTDGNEMWVAELNSDLQSIKEDTIVRCFGQSQDWEKSDHYPAKVTEGAFLVKHEGLYYLTYSANHYKSNDYGVGYATSKHPLGPWEKYEKNPILQSNPKVHGAGHHCLTKSPDGKEWFMVYHTHCSVDRVEPRKLAIDRLYFVPGSKGRPDVIKVKGPTLTPQRMPSGIK